MDNGFVWKYLFVIKYCVVKSIYFFGFDIFVLLERFIFGEYLISVIFRDKIENRMLI